MTAEGDPRRLSRNCATAKQMQGLADAARSRSESDWLIGINGTRAITKRMFGSRAGNVASRRPRADADARDRLRARAGDPEFQTARLLARDREIRDREGNLRRRLSAPEFQKERNDEHDRIDRIWEKARGRSGRRRLPGPAAGRGLRGEESQHADRAAPLRPHHAAARGQRPLRLLGASAPCRSRRRFTSGTR